MAKYKGQKKAQSPVPGKITPKKSAAGKLKSPSDLSRTTFLILFDKRTKLFLIILVAAYLLLGLLKIHTSSIASWDNLFGVQEPESVIAGKPRFIRMDEWLVSTPSALSQYQMGMPLKNEALGGENTPVVMGLPVKDVSILLRPNFWAYFIFDEERAFAFAWDFNIFFSLITTFLLFMLLTRNNFWLSVFGAFFIFFSSGVQWWSYLIGYQMMYLNGMLISFVYILYSKRLRSLMLAGVLLLFSVHGFLFFLYPAFQVPLIYLYLAILIGFLWRAKNFRAIREKLPLRVAVLSVVLVVLGLFLYHYYHLVKDTYTAMLNTVYPGRRFSVGGDLASGKFFSELFGMFMTDSHVPKQWLNICEASSFIMVFPVIFYVLGYNYFKSKNFDPLLLTLSVFVIIGSVYVLFGFPSFLSKITLISMSPSFRALPILGAGNCVLLICFLGSWKTEEIRHKFSWIEFGILTISIIIFIRIVCAQINSATEGFFTPGEINIVTFLITLIYLGTRYKHIRFAKPVLFASLGIMTVSNLSVNPVTVGLSAVLDNPLVKISKEIHLKDPQARWAVFGKEQNESPRLANLIKTNGINVFNGIKFVPPMKDMQVLDSARKYDSVYNRYAWVFMQTYIPGKDSIVIAQTFNDGYTIYMDPCSPRFKQLGVKYIVYPYKPENLEIRCMTKVGEASGIFIYKRNDE